MTRRAGEGRTTERFYSSGPAALGCDTPAPPHRVECSTAEGCTPRNRYVERRLIGTPTPRCRVFRREGGWGGSVSVNAQPLGPRYNCIVSSAHIVSSPRIASPPIIVPSANRRLRSLRTLFLSDARHRRERGCRVSLDRPRTVNRPHPPPCRVFVALRVLGTFTVESTVTVAQQSENWDATDDSPVPQL